MRPIGIFDSGLGGLTVVREIWRAIPGLPVVYLGDTAHVPYGTKSPGQIRRLSYQNARFLAGQGVGMVVVACNTSSAVSLPLLKSRFDCPIVGVIEPGARAAAQATRNGRIGVIGTPATVRSGAYERALKRLLPGAKIFSRPCPLFVPLVEEGWTRHRVALEIAAVYLTPLKRMGIDTLVLGCTHYPLLKPVLRRIMGERIRLIDSAEETARTVRELLSQAPSRDLRSVQRPPHHRFFVTDVPQSFARLARIFLRRRIDTVRRVVVE